MTLQARANGVGQKLRQAMEDYRAVDERLLSELGRNPTLEEIALEMHMTPEDADTVRRVLEDARMLQRATAPKEEEAAGEENQAVEDTAYFQMRQRIAELLSVLPQEDAKLLTLRYGLEKGRHDPRGDRQGPGPDGGPGGAAGGKGPIPPAGRKIKAAA